MGIRITFRLSSLLLSLIALPASIRMTGQTRYCTRFGRRKATWCRCSRRKRKYKTWVSPLTRVFFASGRTALPKSLRRRHAYIWDESGLPCFVKPFPSSASCYHRSAPSRHLCPLLRQPRPSCSSSMMMTMMRRRHHRWEQQQRPRLAAT